MTSGPLAVSRTVYVFQSSFVNPFAMSQAFVRVLSALGKVGFLPLLDCFEGMLTIGLLNINAISTVDI